MRNLRDMFSDSRFKRVDVRRHYPEYGPVLLYYNEIDRVAVLVVIKSPRGDDYAVPEAALRGLEEKQHTGRLNREPRPVRPFINDQPIEPGGVLKLPKQRSPPPWWVPERLPPSSVSGQVCWSIFRVR